MYELKLVDGSTLYAPEFVPSDNDDIIEAGHRPDAESHDWNVRRQSVIAWRRMEEGELNFEPNLSLPQTAAEKKAEEERQAFERQVESGE